MCVTSPQRQQRKRVRANTHTHAHTHIHALSYASVCLVYMRCVGAGAPQPDDWKPPDMKRIHVRFLLADRFLPVLSMCFSCSLMCGVVISFHLFVFRSHFPVCTQPCSCVHSSQTFSRHTHHT